MIRRTYSLYQTSFAGLSPQTWLLSVIMFVNRSGTMVVPFMTLYLTGKGMNRTLSEAGLVMALYGLGSIVGAYYGGKFSDKFGFFKVQVWSLLGGGFLFIVLGQLNSYPLICLFTFLLSLVNESFRPANASAIAHYSNVKNRTRSYSLNRLAINLGWAFGASLGGIIASYNYELLFWVDGITNIGAAVLLLRFLKSDKIAKQDNSETESVPENSSAYKDKTYLWYIVLITIFGFCFFQLFTTLPKYFRDNLFLSEKYIGFIMAINGLLIVAFEMIIVFTLEKKNKIVLFISLGTFLTALSFFSLLIEGDAKFITLFMILLITLGEVIAMPFMNTFWIRRTKLNNRGQYAALYTIAWGIGQTSGPFLCALLVDHTSFSLLFVVLGSLLSFAAIGFYKLGDQIN
jgi:predicted MFS family arabinose efflux permease